MILACSACGAQNRVPAARIDDGPRCGTCKVALTLDAPVHLTTEADLDDLVAHSPRPVLVDFWASWCAPCRAVAPEVSKLASKHAKRLVVAKLSTEEVPAAAARLGISSIPTLVLFKGGREATRLSGAMPASAIEQRLGLNAN